MIKNKTKKTQIVTFRASEEFANFLNKQSEKLNMSKSKIINKACESYFKDIKGGVSNV